MAHRNASSLIQKIQNHSTWMVYRTSPVSTIPMSLYPVPSKMHRPPSWQRDVHLGSHVIRGVGKLIRCLTHKDRTDGFILGYIKSTNSVGLLGFLNCHFSAETRWGTAILGHTRPTRSVFFCHPLQNHLVIVETRGGREDHLR